MVENSNFSSLKLQTSVFGKVLINNVYLFEGKILTHALDRQD